MLLRDFGESEKDKSNKASKFGIEQLGPFLQSFSYSGCIYFH